MQVESGTPPLKMRLNHLGQRAAARLSTKIEPSSPVYDRLPIDLQQQNVEATATKMDLGSGAFATSDDEQVHKPDFRCSH